MEFNRGFLSLRLIDWSTPAHILEKIIHYEAVHAIQSWDDLRARLAPPDRRCFAFFHPALVDEPLIFVEVALCAEMPDAIAPLIDPQRVPLEGSMLTKEATTAVFYSISNCQDGLRGVSFGNFLIKQVVEELKREANALPALKTFVTLSPVPGFVAWLNKERKAKQTALNFVELANLQAIDQPIWPEDPSQVRLLRPLLNRLMTQYLVETKSRNGRPLDAVARFHLGNGARLERLNWLGDRSAKGLKQSAGMMVNYLYDLGDIESNHEAYANQHRVVASRAVTRMLKLNRA